VSIARRFDGWAIAAGVSAMAATRSRDDLDALVAVDIARFISAALGDAAFFARFFARFGARFGARVRAGRADRVRVRLGFVRAAVLRRLVMPCSSSAPHPNGTSS
jgi:hypothetical protein